MKVFSSRSVLPATPHCRFIASAILALSIAPAYAVDYSISGTLDAQATHNDNLRMSESDKVAVDKLLVTPVISLQANTETTKVGLVSVFFFNRYDESQYDSNDQNIGLSASHDFETSSIGLNANLVRESTITSELLTSGVIGETAQRTERYVITPSWSYYVNDSNMLQLAGTYTSQDYPEGYTGYDNKSGSLDWIHILDERIKLVLSAQYSRYEYDDVETSIPSISGLPVLRDTPFGVIEIPVPAGAFGSESYSTETTEKGGQLGVDYQWTEQSMLTSRIGYSKSENSYPQQRDENFCTNPDLVFLWQIEQFRPYLGSCFLESTSDNVWTAQVGWNWKSETQKFDLNGTKQMQPTGNGYTVDSLSVTSNWSWYVTEMDQLSAHLTVIRNRAVGDNDEVRNGNRASRNYGSATVAYRHQFGEQWFVTGSYQYNRQEYLDLQNSDGNANLVSLAVQYRPQAWHWAR